MQHSGNTRQELQNNFVSILGAPKEEMNTFIDEIYENTN